MTSSTPRNSSGLSFSQRERRALARELERHGPDAPTLCEGWTTKDLAAHLVLREYRPDAAAGMFVSPLKKHHDNVAEDIANRDYQRLIEDYRNGPPTWSPMKLMDKHINLLENFVHHEDVRRANGETTPRALATAEREELWDKLSHASTLLLRRTPISVVLIRTDGAEGLHSEVSHTLRRGSQVANDELRIEGPVGELILWTFGRDDAAHVSYHESKPGVRERATRQRL